MGKEDEGQYNHFKHLLFFWLCLYISGCLEETCFAHHQCFQSHPCLKVNNKMKLRSQGLHTGFCCKCKHPGFCPVYQLPATGISSRRDKATQPFPLSLLLHTHLRDGKVTFPQCIRMPRSL